MLITRFKKKTKTWQPWYSWKGIVKYLWKKGKRKLRDNLDDDKREQVKESHKITKKQRCDNLDDYKRGNWKVLITGGKKNDNLDTHEKELLKNYEKKERENSVVTSMMTKENRWRKVIK